ncbi:uncharacterized protein LOC5506398 [Nematostella vectensis]|uniref:uncharacterized protein LOC5506398 n=1 Tax=Nematostella vectensis TaxID=45351 RepID=UPI0020770B9F|nr:uncharacterized protein LOC5506398 [Nematostella vectensis]
MTSRKWPSTQVNQDVVDIARGLYESRVIVRRPPSAAQRDAYRTSYRGPPKVPNERKARPFSAKARISTEKVDIQTAESPSRPPWRPFSGQASLSRVSAPSKETIFTAHCTEEKNNIEEFTVPDVYKNRTLPESLSPLKKWLTDAEDIPITWSQAYSPDSNFVFLPCLKIMDKDVDNLAPVPPPQDSMAPLPFTPVITPPKYKPPKPNIRTFSQDDSSKLALKHRTLDEETASPNQLRMYTKNGQLLHDIYHGKPTAEIIRKEIEDLERLLQGIGNPKGSSIVVRYQHDINHLRDMVKSTLEGYTFPEEARVFNPVAAALQEDLVNYPDRIDEILDSIKKRRDECVKELALLEKDILQRKR